MIAAFWSNDGMNDDKGTRQNAIQELEASFDEAVTMILGGGPKEVEIDKSNPFFAAMEKGMAKLDVPQEDLKTVQAVIEQEKDFTRYIDQD